MVGRRPPTPGEVERLRHEPAPPAPGEAPRPRGGRRTLDVSFDYVAWLQETWIEALRNEQHIVLDPMHGCWASRARRYMNAIFPQCLVSVIHDTQHPEFAGRTPDCSRAEQLQELCAAVYRERAHLGIAFDGDGDRLALVDNEGIALTAEETTWVMLQSYGPQLQGQRFVYDLKLSDCIPAAARALGAEPLVERSGHAFLRARMGETGAVLGAEASGHYFFRELEGGDDGLFAACRIIAHLARSGRTLAQERRACPAVFMTPDLRLPLDVAKQDKVLQEVRRAFAEYPQTALDGVRIDLLGGWALVRSSVTEPALTFRFEGRDWKGLHGLVSRFCTLLPKLGEKLWARYEAAMGTARG
jgi:phosphomannomutase